MEETARSKSMETVGGLHVYPTQIPRGAVKPSGSAPLGGAVPGDCRLAALASLAVQVSALRGPAGIGNPPVNRRETTWHTKCTI